MKTACHLTKTPNRTHGPAYPLKGALAAVHLRPQLRVLPKQRQLLALGCTQLLLLLRQVVQRLLLGLQPARRSSDSNVLLPKAFRRHACSQHKHINACSTTHVTS